MADFDPDAYLNEKPASAAAFDPDAYLALAPSRPKTTAEKLLSAGEWGKAAAGVPEGLASLASGVVAYPLSRITAAGTLLREKLGLGAPKSEVLSAVDPEYAAKEDWRRAGDAKRAVEDAWTYSPRTQVGRDSAQAGANAMGTVLRPLTWVGEKTAEGATHIPNWNGSPQSEFQKQQTRDLYGEAVPLLAAEAGLRGVRAAAAPVSQFAERAAVRSLNADRTATKRVFGRPMNDTAVQETGRYLLDESVPLRSPKAAQEALSGRLSEEGGQMGAALDSATNSGAKVNLRDTVDRILNDPDVKALAKNTEDRPAYERIKSFYEDQVSQLGDEITPRQAHDLRRLVDSKSKWNQASPPADNSFADAMRTSRGTLDDSLEKTMENAGAGKDWTEGNRGYKNAARAKKLADVGAERRAGNSILSLTEKGAGLGAVAAAATHNPAAAAGLAGTILLNRFGFPMAARTADVASRLAVRLPSPPGAVSAPAGAASLEAQALIDALRRGQSATWPIGVAPAAAQEDR